MALPRKHRIPIIAACVVGFALILFLSILILCVRRFNSAAIARRAREAERTAAAAVARAERRRRRGLDLPEAEAAPPSGKYKGPALGNVVIKNADDLKKLKDELIEVDMSKVCVDAKAKKSASMRQDDSCQQQSGASASAGVEGELELVETFVGGVNESPATTRHTMQLAHFSHSGHNNEDGEHGEVDENTIPFGRSLDEGGFVIYVCGEEVGQAEGRGRGNRPGAADTLEAGTAAAAGPVEPIAEGNTVFGSCATIQLYRHQPSRSIYGESRYTSDTEAAVPSH